MKPTGIGEEYYCLNAPKTPHWGFFVWVSGDGVASSQLQLDRILAPQLPVGPPRPVRTMYCSTSARTA